MNIFENKYYAPTIYIALLTISILILFSFVSITENTKNWDKTIDKKIQKNKITGFAVSEQNLTNQTISQELYSETSYTFYYLIIIFLSLSIALFALRLLPPRIKKYT